LNSMEKEFLQKLLGQVASHSVPVEHAIEKLKHLPFEDLGFASIDHHRPLRKGYPEVIFCQNKTPQQVISIVKAQLRQGDTVFGTRADPAMLAAVKKTVRRSEERV
jgi:pyridinium-3,5-biscarboxylic acid mononucleotide synthase